jgi:hypothetical protein
MAISNTKNITGSSNIPYDTGNFIKQNWTEIGGAGANTYAIQDITTNVNLRLQGQTGDTILFESSFADYTFVKNGKAVTMVDGQGHHVVLTLSALSANRTTGTVSVALQFLDGLVTVSNSPGSTKLRLTGISLIDPEISASQELTNRPRPVTISADSSSLVSANYFGSVASDSTYVLTTGIDIATAQVFNATLSNNSYDGVGPTLNSYDQLTGAAATGNSLNIVDGYGSASDILPAGLTLNNIQNVTLNTAGTAGQANLQQGTGATSGNTFNTSTFASVTSTVVNSQGDGYSGYNGSVGDSVQASSNSSITVNHANVGGSVATFGGNVVTVNTNGNGGVYVMGYENGSSQSLPTGAVTVNANGYLQGAANVLILGGTNVSVNIARGSATGNILIGNYSVIDSVASGALNPTGTISVVDNSVAAFYGVNGSIDPNVIDITGGTNVTVSAKGDDIYIGQNEYSDLVGAATDSPSGTITVTNMQPIAFNGLTGTGNSNYQGGEVEVYGGTNVSVTTNTGGGVTIGADNGTITKALPTGTITVVDTASDLDYAYQITDWTDEINIQGGTTVSVQAAGAGVYIGTSGGPGCNGYTNLLDNPTGAVTVTQTKASSEEIYIDGGNGITVNAQGQTVVLGSYTGVAGNVVVNQSSVYTGAAASNTAGVDLIRNRGTTGVDSTVQVDGGANVTVNTTGGDVSVGTRSADGYAVDGASVGETGGDLQVHVPTGAVNITNTFSGAVGANASEYSVYGGTTVNITVTNTTNADIEVGEEPALNLAGTALLNPELSPTGDVTIENVVTNGDVTTFGASLTEVYTNGAKTVSASGVNGGFITDINSLALTGGSRAGQAAGISTLSTVNINGVQGAVIIDSNALTTLIIANTAGLATVADITVGNLYGYTQADHALALTLENIGYTSEIVNGVNISTAYTVITDATATSLTIDTTGTADNDLELSVAKATSIVFNNDAAVEIDLLDANVLTTITANNSARLILDDVSTYTNLASIDGTNSTATIAVELTAQISAQVSGTSFKGGTGNDFVIANTSYDFNGQASRLDGGAGTNRIVVTNMSDMYTSTQGVNGPLINSFTNFQNLGIGGPLADGVYNVAGFGDIALLGGFDTASQTTITFNKVTAGSTVSFWADATAPTVPTAVQSYDPTIHVVQAASGAQTINIGNTEWPPLPTDVDALDGVDVADLRIEALGNYGGTAQLTIPTSVTINSIGIADWLYEDAYNTVNVSTDGTPYSVAPGVPAQTTTLAVTGNTDIEISNNYVAAATTSSQLLFTGATVTNTGDTDLFNVTWANGGATITGGAGLLTVDLSDSSTLGNPTGTFAAFIDNADLLTSGTGGVFATLGAYDGLSATGSDKVILTASSAVRDTLVALTDPALNGTSGTNALVTGFANGITGDVLAFSNIALSSDQALENGITPIVIDNVLSADAITGASATGATYTVSNGIISIKSAGTSTIDDNIADAIAIVVANTAALSGDYSNIGAIQLSGSTYVINDVGGSSTTNAPSVIQLSGVTGVTGFTASYDSQGANTVQALQLGAGNSIAIATDYPGVTFSNVTKFNGGNVTTSTTYNDTGYAVDTFAGTNSGVTTTYSNLGNAASLLVSDVNDVASGSNGGDVVVTQLGTNSQLAIVSGAVSGSSFNPADATIHKLTYGGNLVIDSTLGCIHIGELKSSTSTQIQITGDNGDSQTGGQVVIDKITDTNLTLIDASSSIVTLIEPQGTIPVPVAAVVLGAPLSYLSQTGLTVLGGLGGIEVYASGAGDTFTTLDLSAINTIYATGANNVFNLDGLNDAVYAGGANDVFNVVRDDATGVDVEDYYINGNPSGVANDNYTGGVGANAVINQADTLESAVTVNLEGTFTGGTSASYNFTTLNNASANDNLLFNNYSNSGTETYIGQVNVASATTLAQALDLAAAVASASDSSGKMKVAAYSGVIDWFQFDGNTYIVETVNQSGNAAAQTGINANDVVVELTGLVDLTAASYSNGVLDLGGIILV